MKAGHRMVNAVSNDSLAYSSGGECGNEPALRSRKRKRRLAHDRRIVPAAAYITVHAHHTHAPYAHMFVPAKITSGDRGNTGRRLSHVVPMLPFPCELLLAGDLPRCICWGKQKRSHSQCALFTQRARFSRKLAFP